MKLRTFQAKLAGIMTVAPLLFKTAEKTQVYNPLKFNSTYFMLYHFFL